MDICNRIANQSAINYYAQIKRNQLLDDADCLETEGKKKGKSSTKAWVLGAFYSTSKLPGKNSASLVPLPKTSAATAVDPARPLPETAEVNGAEPSIHFDEYRIHIRAERFKFCLVGKFPLSRPSLEQIKEWAATEWKLEGNCWITLLDQSHVFIRLENEADMIHVWPRNQCFVEGHVMKVFKWTPTFRPSDGEPSSAAVWISFPSLPVVFYEQDLLYPIASKVGKVLGMDDDTRNLTRTTFARVCLEVDLLKKAPRRIWIGVGKGGFWQRIEYEDLPNYCTICCMIGHTTKLCSRNDGNMIVDRSEEKGPSCSFKNFHAKGGCYHTYPLLNRSMLVHSVKSKVEKDPKRREVEIVGEQRHSANGINNEFGTNQDLIGCNLRQNSTNDGIDISKQVRSLGNGVEKVKFHTEVKQETIHVIEEEFHEVEEQDDNDDELGNRDSQFSQNKEHNQAKGVHEDETTIKSQGNQSNSIRSYITASNPISLWKKHPKKTIGVVPNPCRKFSFTEIKRATRNFKGDRIIGQGGFGQVYKGVLHGGAIVAIKRCDAQRSMERMREFRTEIELLSRLSCKHLVTLIGYCDKKNKMILVYEYMSKGSLASFLFSNPVRPSWDTRMQIAFGIAKGLVYLHEECRIIHCDIKPENTLLDEHFTARIADFGLAKLLTTDQSRVTGIRGTIGYVAPEWFTRMAITTKVDVYSYGVMLLEIICCRKNVDTEVGEEERVILSDWAYDCYSNGILDLLVEGDEEAMNGMRNVERLVKVAMWCIQEEPSLRPLMKKVSQMLEGTVEVAVPPNPSTFIT